MVSGVARIEFILKLRKKKHENRWLWFVTEGFVLGRRDALGLEWTKLTRLQSHRVELLELPMAKCKLKPKRGEVLSLGQRIQSGQI